MTLDGPDVDVLLAKQKAFLTQLCMCSASHLNYSATLAKQLHVLSLWLLYQHGYRTHAATSQGLKHVMDDRWNT